LTKILDLMPAAWRPYAKAIVAVVGLILGALMLTLPVVPVWLPVVVNTGVLLGVWGVPNQATESGSSE
jgi:hypothetical protein